MEYGWLILAGLVAALFVCAVVFSLCAESIRADRDAS